jgi:hypothetical protein
MRTRLLFMVLAVVGWCGVWTTPSEAFFTDFHSAPTSCQGDTESFGSWDVIFAGLGCVNKETDDEADPQHKVFLHLQPQTSTAADEHHAALVCGPTFTAENISYYFMADMNTIAQTRQNFSPNFYETAWLVFDYVDNDHFNYFFLSATGYELGMRHPSCAGGQCFLATGASPTVSIGDWVTVEIDRDYTDGDNNFQVYLNGSTTPLININYNTHILHTGRICLYTEDAHAHYTNVEANQNE